MLFIEKYAASMPLATDLALKYNSAVQNVQNRFGISPRTVSYGPTKQNISVTGQGYDRYVSSISAQESAGKLNAINKSSGAMGLYQFMPKTLRGLGFQGDFKTFLSDANLQRQYMDKFTRQNAAALKIDMNKLGPREITLLSAAHYGGVGGARKFMNNDTKYMNTAFYNKTPISYTQDILRRYSGR